MGPAQAGRQAKRALVTRRHCSVSATSRTVSYLSGEARTARVLVCAAGWLAGWLTLHGRLVGGCCGAQPRNADDTFDVTPLLRPGAANVIAVECFYWTAAQESAQVGCPPGESAFCVNGSSTDLDPTNRRDRGGVLAWMVRPPRPTAPPNAILIVLRQSCFAVRLAHLLLACRSTAPRRRPSHRCCVRAMAAGWPTVVATSC